MKYKMCVWDLDGTLLNTLPTLHHFDNEALKKYNLHPVTMEQSKILIKHSVEDYHSTLLKYGGCPEDRINEIIDEFGKYNLALYLDNFSYKTEEFKGVRDTIHKLNNLGIVNVVFSNKPNEIAQKLVRKFFNEQEIKFIIAQTNDSKPKPYVGCTDNLMKEAKLDKSELLIIGDTEVDMLAAKNNGIDVVAVKWGYQDEKVLLSYNPTHIIENPEDLLNIVKE